jgi:transcriptional regulator with PAS, ATPase and Fis domain
LEVGKALRTNGPNGHSFHQAVGRPADYVAIAEENDPQHLDADPQELASVSAPAVADRATAITSAWIAADPASVRLTREARSIARTSSAVLIRGESGTGKDLLAWILHALSPRADRPLVRIDCASLPADLIESELFGYEQGIAASTGRVELASGGTLVLDEVAALSVPAQARLLRLIEDRRFDSSSNGHGSGVDTRIIALTTTNLDQAVSRRTFREDLYYRLNVIPIVIPPLRERTTDIRPLATAFLNRYADMNRRPRPVLDPLATAALESYSFPGNVRELRNFMERTIQSAVGTDVQLIDLPPQVRESFSGAARNKMSLEDLERAYISEVLDQTRGKKTMAAKILGISRKTLLEKRKRYGLD